MERSFRSLAIPVQVRYGAVHGFNEELLREITLV